MSWSIEILPSATKDLMHFEKADRVTVAANIDRRLRQDPTVETRNLKRLRPNPFADYELRVGRFRVLYRVEPEDRRIVILLVGEKIGNRLIAGGKEFTNHHESRESQ